MIDEYFNKNCVKVPVEPEALADTIKVLQKTCRCDCVVSKSNGMLAVKFCTEPPPWMNNGGTKSTDASGYDYVAKPVDREESAGTTQKDETTIGGLPVPERQTIALRRECFGV